MEARQASCSRVPTATSRHPLSASSSPAGSDCSCALTISRRSTSASSPPGCGSSPRLAMSPTADLPYFWISRGTAVTCWDQTHGDSADFECTWREPCWVREASLTRLAPRLDYFFLRTGFEPFGRGTAYWPVAAVPAPTAVEAAVDGASAVGAAPPKPTLRTEPLVSKKITCARSAAPVEALLVKKTPPFF